MGKPRWAEVPRLHTPQLNAMESVNITVSTINSLSNPQMLKVRAKRLFQQRTVSILLQRFITLGKTEQGLVRILIQWGLEFLA